MLEKDPTKRIGYYNGISEVFQEPWCKKVSLKDISNKNISPVIKPNPFTMYFE